MTTILITGASGRIGQTLVKGLMSSDFFTDSYREFKLPDCKFILCDIDCSKEIESNNKIWKVNILDFESLLEITKGVDCIIHLAGIPDEDGWDNILQSNISGTYNVLEAARINQVPRVILASSNRVISFYPKNKKINTKMPPRPDGLYGVSKVCNEAMARLYADKYGISVACLRIGSFEDQPKNLRHLSTWISPRDLIQLFYRCIVTPAFHFLVIYGVSANKRNQWDNSGAEFLGFLPEDNAEDYSALFQDEESENAVLKNNLEHQFHGGNYCLEGFKGDISRIQENENET